MAGRLLQKISCTTLSVRSAFGIGIVSGPLYRYQYREDYEIGPSATIRVYFTNSRWNRERRFVPSLLVGTDLSLSPRKSTRIQVDIPDSWDDWDGYKLRQHTLYLAPSLKYQARRIPLSATLAIGGHLQVLRCNWWGGYLDSAAQEYYFENQTGGSIIAQIEFRHVWAGISLHLNKLSRVGKSTDQSGQPRYGTQWYDSNPIYISVGWIW